MGDEVAVTCVQQVSRRVVHQRGDRQELCARRGVEITEHEGSLASLFAEGGVQEVMAIREELRRGDERGFAGRTRCGNRDGRTAFSRDPFESLETVRVEDRAVATPRGVWGTEL